MTLHPSYQYIENLNEIANKRMDFHFETMMKIKDDVLEMWREEKEKNRQLMLQVTELQARVDLLYSHLAPDMEEVWECPVEDENLMEEEEEALASMS